MMAESPKEIASLSSTAAGFRKVFSSSSASSLRRKAFPKARYRLPPMCYVGARRFAAPTLSRQGQNVQLLSDCHFQSRKDRYLPYQPHPTGSCRTLTGLPAHSSGCDLPSAIAAAKSHPPPSSPEMTDVRPMAFASNDRNPTPEKSSRRHTYI